MANGGVKIILDRELENENLKRQEKQNESDTTSREIKRKDEVRRGGLEEKK